MSNCIHSCPYDEIFAGEAKGCGDLIRYSSLVCGPIILVHAVASAIFGTLTLAAVAFRSLVGICLLASGVTGNFCCCFIPTIIGLGTWLAMPPAAAPITAAVMPMVVK